MHNILGRCYYNYTPIATAVLFVCLTYTFSQQRYPLTCIAIKYFAMTRGENIFTTENQNILLFLSDQIYR